jgi:hypothetical protein
MLIIREIRANEDDPEASSVPRATDIGFMARMNEQCHKMGWVEHAPSSHPSLTLASPSAPADTGQRVSALDPSRAREQKPGSRHG